MSDVQTPQNHLSALRTHRTLALENLALRQPLALLGRTMKRPRLTKTDRLFWVFLCWPWTSSPRQGELENGTCTLVGLVPIVYQKPALAGVYYYSMALVIMGGLVVSTFLTSVLLPTTASLAEDGFALFGRGIVRGWRLVTFRGLKPREE